MNSTNLHYCMYTWIYTYEYVSIDFRVYETEFWAHTGILLKEEKWGIKKNSLFYFAHVLRSHNIIQNNISLCLNSCMARLVPMLYSDSKKRIIMNEIKIFISIG